MIQAGQFAIRGQTPCGGSDIRHPTSNIVGRVVITLVTLALAAAPAMAQMSITSISPDTGWSVKHPLDGTFNATITGDLPIPGVTVTLSRAGQLDIVGTEVTWVSATETTANFDLVGAAPGPWDLEVTHPALGSAVLEGGFTLKPPPSLRRIGAWGGPVQAMEVVGNLGYVARGSGMVILDLTDPANMIELGSLDLNASVVDIAVQGNYAYVGAIPPRYLCVVDVSDPAAPQLVASGLRNRTSTKTPLDITLSGDAAYIKFGTAGSPGWRGEIFVLDISDPETLNENAHFHEHGLHEDISEVFKTTVAGNYLYLIGLNADFPEPHRLRLYVFDLSSDPVDPPLVGEMSLFSSGPWEVYGVAIEGDFVYVVMRNPNLEEAKLVIVNVSDPANPFLNGQFSSDDMWPTGVAVSNGIAYVADWEVGRDPLNRIAKGLAVIDVTNPIAPTLAGEFLTQGSVFGVTVAGTTAYLLDRGEGVIAMDVSDPANPVRLGNWHSPAFTHHIDKEGDTLYVSDWWNGITALDVSDGRTPQLLGVHQTDIAPPFTGENNHVRVENGLAYLVAGFNGLEVVDFADPANPVLVGGFQPVDQDPGSLSEPLPVALATAGDVLLMTGWDGSGTGQGLWTFDLTTPANPVLASFENALDGFACTVHVDWAMTDDLLAIGVSDGPVPRGILRDVSDPWNPVTLAGGCEELLNIDGDYVAVDSGRVYSVRVDSNGLLAVWDLVQQPEVDLSFFASVELNHAQGIAVQNGIAYHHGKAQIGVSSGGNPRYTERGVVARNADTLSAITTVSGAGSNEIGTLFIDGPNLYSGGTTIDPQDAAHAPGLAIHQSAAPGDADGDFLITQTDLDAFDACFSGPGVEPPEAICLVFDFDEDGDVDCDDWAWFAALFLLMNPDADPPTSAHCTNDPLVIWATSDPAEFTAFATAKGLTQTGFEDFEEAILPPDSAVSMGLSLLDEFTDNGIFSPGDIEHGLSLDSNLLLGEAFQPADPQDGYGVIAFSPAWNGATSKAITGTLNFEEVSLDLIFDPAANVTAVGFDRVTINFDRNDVQIMVFDTGGQLLRRFNGLSGSVAGEFFGFCSNRPIGRINIWTPNTVDLDYAAADNIQMWSAVPPCPADYDGDGAVGAADLAQLLGSWGPCDGYCPADLDDSGDVGAFDLALLLGSWGECE